MASRFSSAAFVRVVPIVDRGSAADVTGAHDGTLVGTAGFAPGVVGQAFSFDGRAGSVLVPDAPALDPINAIMSDGRRCRVADRRAGDRHDGTNCRLKGPIRRSAIRSRSMFVESRALDQEHSISQPGMIERRPSQNTFDRRSFDKLRPLRLQSRSR